MELNKIGAIIKDELIKTEQIRSNVHIDDWTIMPNHVHFILWVLDDCRGTARRAPTIERFGKPTIGSVPTIIRSFKSAATKSVNGFNPLFGPVWQRNYYERIIRNDAELSAIRKYIVENPLKWESDPERNDGVTPDADILRAR
jgi:REP element-mobilizing transposase RayT